MRINQISEGFNVVENIKRKMKYSDLTPIQIAALRGTSENRIDFENMSERMEEVIQDLRSFGLLDDDFKLTQIGQKVVDTAKQHGGYDRNRAKEMKKIKQRNPEPNRHYDQETGDEFEGGFEYREDDYR